MKNGKKPTVAQRDFIAAAGLDPKNWLVVKDTPERMDIAHRFLSSTRQIYKGGTHKRPVPQFHA